MVVVVVTALWLSQVIAQGGVATPGVGAVKLPPRAAEPDIRLRAVEGRPQPEPGGALEVPRGHDILPPAGADQLHFRLEHLEFRGAGDKFLPVLEAMVEGRYGTSVSLADIYRLASEVQQYYREDGYFLTRVLVPPQHIAAGRMYIQVLEGYIDEVEVQGDVGPVQSLIKDYLAAVTAEQPLRLATLERALMLAKDIPGVEVQGVLQRSENAIGASRLMVTAQRDRIDGLVLADNIGSTFTGEWEMAGRVGINALSRHGGSLSFTGLLSDPGQGVSQGTKNQKVAMFNGSVRLGASGAYLTGFASYGDSNPGSTIAEFDYNSKKLLVSVSGNYPVIRRRSHSLFVDLGFDYIDSDTDIFEDLPFLSDRLRVLQLGATYDFRDRWRGSTYARLAIRRGLEQFGATEPEDVMASRFDASGKFTSLQLTLSRLQAISDRWALYALASAQYAFDPVLADEEFDVGGIDFGRGYDPKEISADNGVGVTAELQYTRPSGFSFLDRYQVFGFYDFGAVRQEESDLVEETTTSLASAGIGIRGWFARDLSLELQLAKPLTLPSTRADGTKDPQLLVRAIARF